MILYFAFSCRFHPCLLIRQSGSVFSAAEKLKLKNPTYQLSVAFFLFRLNQFAQLKRNLLDNSYRNACFTGPEPKEHGISLTFRKRKILISALVCFKLGAAETEYLRFLCEYSCPHIAVDEANLGSKHFNLTWAIDWLHDVASDIRFLIRLAYMCQSKKNTPQGCIIDSCVQWQVFDQTMVSYAIDMTYRVHYIVSPIFHTLWANDKWPVLLRRDL